MQAETGRLEPEPASGVTAVLVLLCGDLEDSPLGLDLALVEARTVGRVAGVSVRVIDGLCHRPGAIREGLDAASANRLVLGLCSRSYSEFEMQAQVRRAGLDPLGVQTLDLSSLGPRDQSGVPPETWAMVLIRAAVMRTRAFRGSRPENSRAVLLSSSQEVSRRALFTLPPVSYVAVPTIDRDSCAAPEGCDRCVAACPHGALWKDKTSIQIDRARCQSCGACVEACPQRAVEFPGWSADEIESQVSGLLNGDVAREDRLLAFACKKAPIPPGNGWLPVSVPCLSMVPVAAVLGSISLGAPVVALHGCGDDCSNRATESVKGRVDYCQQLLRSAGDEPGRVRLVVSGDGGDNKVWASLPPLSGKRTDGAARFFGREASARVVAALASRFGADDLSLEHPHSPLGLVEIDPETCTGCGTCAVACPTDALSYHSGKTGVELAFDASLCIACGECRAWCPEQAAGAISLVPCTDLSRLNRGKQVVLTANAIRCERCGKGFASQRMLDRLASILGDDYSPELMARLCSDCRSPTAARS